MAWNTSLVNRLRFYIGDIDETNEVWSNTQLAKLITIAALDVLNEISLSNVTSKTLTINTDTPSISPDPTSDTDIKDTGVPELFILRAAHVIALSEYRKDISKFGIRIRDDNTSFDGTAALKGRAEVFQLYKENYERAVWEWEKGNRASCRAILGPYASADFALGLTDRQFPLYYSSRRNG